ncbi:MAG: glycerate kinase [Parasphingorhabdus sp.]|uniref:glycerate kinase type-2 family protein n=1 Tax=Parasphingorhabdus sp. TaxID=2709688 RepID=UPI0032999D46
MRSIYSQALAPALPANALLGHNWPRVSGRIFVLSVGKAAAQMMAAIGPHLPNDADGLIVTRQGFAPLETAQMQSIPGNIELVEAAHPVPDNAGADAAQRALASADQLGKDDLLLVLMSGGASALMPAPIEGLTLTAKQKITKALLHSGAPIDQMNIVRKHLSAIKGGRLAQRAYPASTHMIAISDIPGDDMGMIGSGPTMADASTCADALAIIDRYAIAIPDSIRTHLETGHFETPKPGTPPMEKVSAELCAKPADMCEAARAAVTAHGYETFMLGDALEGDAVKLGQEQAKLALHYAAQKRKVALISGGEATVAIRNFEGRGGRCSTYLLACALALEGAHQITAIAADSDGIDGSEDNAGAFLWPDILQAMGGKQSAQSFLDNDNSYLAFEKADALHITGPSGTNVNDLRIILVG